MTCLEMEREELGRLRVGDQRHHDCSLQWAGKEYGQEGYRSLKRARRHLGKRD